MAEKTALMELGYKGYYHEHSEWYTEHIKTTSRREALRKFARRHRVGRVNLRNAEQWKWWEGDWFTAFRYVKKSDVRPCHHCQGTGKISIKQD